MVRTGLVGGGVVGLCAMADGAVPRARETACGESAGKRAAVCDAGFRSYRLSVYECMASGWLLTGIVALLFASSGLARDILMGPGILKYVIMFSPLAFVMVMSFGINRISTPTLQLLFWAFATVMGLSDRKSVV